jgi:ferritin-like metal-binding protein YciE
MLVENPKELFVLMLSDVRYGAEVVNNFYRELAKLVEDRDVKEALEARLFVSDKNVKALDKCFELIGEKPMKVSGRLYDVFFEDFRKEIAEIKAPAARRLFILAKINRLFHLRIGEYVGLIAAADSMGHYGIGVLLESCLADKLAFVERTRRLIRERVREAVATA